MTPTTFSEAIAAVRALDARLEAERGCLRGMRRDVAEGTSVYLNPREGREEREAAIDAQLELMDGIWDEWRAALDVAEEWGRRERGERAA